MQRTRFAVAREGWLLNYSAASTPRRGCLPGVRARIIVLVLGVITALTGGELASAAPQVVTVCGRDNAPGGLNLATAIAAGGEIVIRCPAGQQAVELTGTLNARGIVHVDGEGKVTLHGPVAGPLFTADISLRLSRLTVENPRTAATASAPGAGTIILGPKASVDLDGVTTQNSLAAYVAQSLTAQDSIFLRNGDSAEQTAFAAVINADSIELRRVTFTGNFDHPIAGGSPPAIGRPALSRRIVIEDSVFTGNRSTMLLTDARVSIRRTRFEGNGTPRDKWGGAWECCGGAITLVRADADLSDTEFRDNAAAGFGGAIYALGSRLRITRSVFERNKGRVGGAVMFWGRRPKVNIWSTEDWPDPPRLELRRTQFRGNTATAFGGSLVFAGTVEGDAVLFQANVSDGTGGAIADWRAAVLPDPYGGVFDALVGATQPNQPDSIALARPILVDNRAGSRGAALAAGSAAVAIGNGLIARNQVTAAPSGGAVSGAKVTLVNTTLADNPAGGLVVAAGATARLGNTILLRNAGFNCALGGTLSDAGRNIQSPGNDCGAAVGARDPGLDGQYAPGLISAARGAGDTGMCAADPQVRGVDLFGKSRLERGRCDVGAIERPLPQTVASALGLGSGSDAVPRLLWLLVLLVILLFLLGLLWAAWRRRRRSGLPPACI
jgi:predicted outer membrane repeat protein